jgi:N-acyl-D-amino-acid deacylase
MSKGSDDMGTQSPESKTVQASHHSGGSNPLATRPVKTLITGGKVIDGSGNPWFYSDILIEGDAISRVAPGIRDKIGQEPGHGYQVIDATGKIVCPGFIDIHGHSDAEVFIDGTARSSVMQGITTEIVGNCGNSAFPLVGQFPETFQKFIFELYEWTEKLPWSTLDDYLQVVGSQGLSINIGALVGHASIRTAVSGYANRDLSSGEFQECGHLLREALEQGAFGMSLGLYYAPGSYAKIGEVIEFGKVVADYHGLVTCHLRDESDYNIGLLAALQEMLCVARDSGARVEISHMKCVGPATWGLAGVLVKTVEDARKRGFDVATDQYPYLAACSSIIGSLIPRWAQSGSKQDFSDRLKDPHIRQRIKTEAVRNLARRGGPERLVIGRYPPKPEYSGKSLAEISEITGFDPAETTLRLVELFNPQLVTFSMKEEDLLTIMKAPFVMIASDGRALRPEGVLSSGPPHPRSFGTFPRVISKYALDSQVITLEDAVRKMTSMPAERLNIKDRGYVKPGFKADIVVFDPITIKDNATFDSPRLYPSGIEYVFVNGQVVVAEGEHTEAKPGMVLRHRV